MRSFAAVLFLMVVPCITSVAQWTWSQNINVSVWGMAAHDTTVYAGDLGWVRVTSDHGDSWSALDAPGYVRNILFRDTMIMITVDGQGVFRSMDAGTTWEAINTGIDEPPQVWSLAQNDSLLIVGTSGNFGGEIAEIYISSDNGDTWSPVFSLGMFDVFYSFSTYEHEVYVGVLPSGVYYSGDKGVTWELRNSMLPAKFISYREDHLLCAITGGTGGIYRSTDGAVSWDLVLPIYSGKAFATSDEKTFVGTSNGIYYSLDAGISWQLYNEGLPPTTTVTAITISGQWIFIGTSEDGIYRRLMTDIITGSTEGHQPLLSIFPNPTSDAFTISGTILAGPTNVRIYNAIGECVYQQLSDLQGALRIGLADLRAGLYHVEIVNGTDRSVHKVIMRRDH